MNTFILGAVAGGVVVGAAVGIIAALVFINSKLKTIIGVLQMIMAKLNKIDQTTGQTMQAAENFVDALHQSAEGMMFGPPRLPQQGGASGKDDFEDLRETFEEGIRDLEEESDEDEDNWKKGT